MGCDERGEIERVLERVREGDLDPMCRDCGGILKTATISFGQSLVEADLRRAFEAASQCDLMLAIGTTLARIEDGEAPEYFALLTVHAGELARHGSSLADLAGRATTVDELHGAIAGENRVFLEDPSPSARVRSYEWLRRREQAPTDFDPLASRDEPRRPLRGESTGSDETPTAETATADKESP